MCFFFSFTGDSYSSGTDVEVIHNKFCRKVFCVKKSTNLSSIYGELGRVPLSVIRKCDRIRYWLRILKLPQNSVVRLVYNMLKKKDADSNFTYNKHNWPYHVKKLLQSLGFYNLWINQEIETKNFQLIKQRIYDQYYQSWYSNINNSPSLHYYSIFKHSFTQEQYLNFISDKNLRIALCKFS